MCCRKAGESCNYCRAESGSAVAGIIFFVVLGVYEKFKYTHKKRRAACSEQVATQVAASAARNAEQITRQSIGTVEQQTPHTEWAKPAKLAKRQRSEQQRIELGQAGGELGKTWRRPCMANRARATVTPAGDIRRKQIRCAVITHLLSAPLSTPPASRAQFNCLLQFAFRISIAFYGKRMRRFALLRFVLFCLPHRVCCARCLLLLLLLEPTRPASFLAIWLCVVCRVVSCPDIAKNRKKACAAAPPPLKPCYLPLSLVINSLSFLAL